MNLRFSMTLDMSKKEKALERETAIFMIHEKLRMADD